MRRTTLVLIAGCLATFAVAASAFYLYGRPNYVRVAVTRDTTDHRLMMAASQILTRERAGVRFRLVAVNDPAASVRALDTGNVDLAISRSDAPLPVNGKTVAVLHTSSVVIVAPAKSPIKTFLDLRSRKIGLLDSPSRKANTEVLRHLLSHYSVQPAEIEIRPVTISTLGAAIKAGEIDALFMVDAVANGTLSDAINAMASAGEGEPVFVPIDQAQGIAKFSNAFNKATLVGGIFGGSAKRPKEDVETISVTVRLFASNNASNQLIANVTRAIFELKPKLAVANPLALEIEAPETGRDAKMPAHPGAVAYLDNEEVSLYDRFSDLFYLSAMVLSLLGSVAAAFASQFSSDGRREQATRLSRLTEILQSARRADTFAVLELLQQETDAMLTELMLKLANGKGGGLGLEAVSLLVNQIHTAIRDRRDILRREEKQNIAAPVRKAS
jgi:TRAP transporter TAXI family solute receptor